MEEIGSENVPEICVCVEDGGWKFSQLVAFKELAQTSILKRKEDVIWERDVAKN